METIGRIRREHFIKGKTITMSMRTLIGFSSSARAPRALGQPQLDCQPYGLATLPRAGTLRKGKGRRASSGGSVAPLLYGRFMATRKPRRRP
jgi:hypothetical protein